MNVYIDLTKEFNAGGLRAVISSGQAVVLHRLAIMSKDGDWILKEDDECLAHVLGVLAERGARYRFGAPLDVRWMSGGWSSHFEFCQSVGARHAVPLRVRTDFVTRPARLSAERLEGVWREAEGREVPFVNARDLVEIKKTNREIDYAVIGELARLMSDPRDQFLCSRSPSDLIELADRHPQLASELAERRPLLRFVPEGERRLEEALDAERRELMRANKERLAVYMNATKVWSAAWPELKRQVVGMPLKEAHELVVERAEGVMPFRIEE